MSSAGEGPLPRPVSHDSLTLYISLIILGIFLDFKGMDYLGSLFSNYLKLGLKNTPGHLRKGWQCS